LRAGRWPGVCGLGGSDGGAGWLRAGSSAEDVPGYWLASGRGMAGAVSGGTVGGGLGWPVGDAAGADAGQVPVPAGVQPGVERAALVQQRGGPVLVAVLPGGAGLGEQVFGGDLAMAGRPQPRPAGVQGGGVADELAGAAEVAAAVCLVGGG